MFLAGMHNGISRLYETFGNGGAIPKSESSGRKTTRAPGTVRIRRSRGELVQRDNNNYEESALLSTLSYFSHNTHHFLENYYGKSKRAVEKPSLEGPAAYVIPANQLTPIVRSSYSRY